MPRETRFFHGDLGKISYQLHRRRRARLKIRIDHAGVSVNASLSESIHRIEQFIHQYETWIHQTLEKIPPHPSLNEWEVGKSILYLGEPIQLGLSQHDQIFFKEKTLLIPSHVSSIKTGVQEWLKTQARQLFKERLDYFKEKTGLFPQEWRLSQAMRTWGTCRENGKISLNWRLIHLPISAIDYVIVHELCHLLHFNHSKTFWQTLENIMPDYRIHQENLKQYPLFRLV